MSRLASERVLRRVEVTVVERTFHLAQVIDAGQTNWEVRGRTWDKRYGYLTNVRVDTVIVFPNGSEKRVGTVLL